MQDCLIRPAPVFHSLNPLVQAGMRDVSEIFQNQIQVLNRAGLQPLRDIRTGADLTGSAAVMQAVPAIHILRLVADQLEGYSERNILSWHTPSFKTKKRELLMLHSVCRCGSRFF